MRVSRLSVISLLFAGLTAPCIGEPTSFYQDPHGLFTTRPLETKSVQQIKCFGPVGLAIDLVKPAFGMRVAGVEEGSPAAAIDRFEKGQIIESVNGEALKDIDPRMQMARWIGEAEASDGKLTFVIQGEAEPAVVRLPVLGRYSETWPVDCEKSDKIVRGLADWISASPKHYGKGEIGMWFLISTGDPKDTAAVGKWARQHQFNDYAWYIGFGGVPMCEYYLRTGDEEVLPVIQDGVNRAVKTQYNDAWAGRGTLPGLLYGNGHLNAAGTSMLTFLLLAKECGAEVPDHALLGALRHFFRYSGKGGNPYGDNRPELGFVDNGKNGNLAFAMAAAAALDPNGEDSLYAMARDANAATSFYTTSYMLHGHTGGGIGEIWRSAAMGLLKNKKPEQYREFMDQRRWHYELSRRFDGSFAIQGGAGYNSVNWGSAYGLAYTVPRKTMRVTGAVPTKYSKRYELPKQIWGNEADNEFLSLEAVADTSGKMADLSGETLAEDSGMPVLRKIHAEDVSDDTLRFYMHHQDPVIRETAAGKVVGINLNYIGWRKESGEARQALILEFLKSKSPRVRRAMFSAIDMAIYRKGKVEVLTPEVFELAVEALKDPEESWWVKDGALHVIRHAAADQVEPHMELLFSYLDANEWWLQNAAMQALVPIVADLRCYRKVLPEIADLLRTNQRTALALGLPRELLGRIQQGPEEVQKLAIQTLRETYTRYAGVDVAPGGQDISKARQGQREWLAASMAEVPGGLEVLYEMVREEAPGRALPYKDIFLKADPELYGEKLKAAMPPIIMNEMIPEFVGRNQSRLQSTLAMDRQHLHPGSKGDFVDRLVALYQRAGHHDYDWEIFVDPREADWFYHTFDPIESEQVPWDALISRFREVTPPQGMEQWFASDFDAAKTGWKLGKSPFGNYDGGIPKGPVSKCQEKCVGPICDGAKPSHTLWDKEVLMMRKTLKVPKLEDGHRYRLRVNHRAHVGNGGGYAVFINGKLLAQQEKCLGLGTGEDANGGFITPEFFDEFDGGEITIAAMSFLRYSDKFIGKPKTRVPQGRISIHIEQQKLPPMGDELILQSAPVAAMNTSAWHDVMLDLENNKDVDVDSLLYHWDGKTSPNPLAMGQWKVAATVDDPEAYDPEQAEPARHAFVSQLDLGETNVTGDKLILWTGDHLINLRTYEAQKVVAREVAGQPYLFVESGGFNGKKPRGATDKRWLVFAGK